MMQWLGVLVVSCVVRQPILPAGCHVVIDALAPFVYRTRTIGNHSARMRNIGDWGDDANSVLTVLSDPRLHSTHTYVTFSELLE
jgi:hypothetical protein